MVDALDQRLEGVKYQSGGLGEAKAVEFEITLLVRDIARLGCWYSIWRLVD